MDDDPDVRQFLSDSLETIGFRVILAEDGASGLSALEASTPDVLLLDFAMPGMSGAEVADRVRIQRPNLPIVFASGHSDTAAIEKAVGPSAVLLRKPFRIDDLEAALRAAVAGHAQGPATARDRLDGGVRPPWCATSNEDDWAGRLVDGGARRRARTGPPGSRRW